MIQTQMTMFVVELTFLLWAHFHKRFVFHPLSSSQQSNSNRNEDRDENTDRDEHLPSALPLGIPRIVLDQPLLLGQHTPLNAVSVDVDLRWHRHHDQQSDQWGKDERLKEISRPVTIAS